MVVQEDQFDAVDGALVYTNRVPLVGLNFDVFDVLEAILSEVPSHSFLVPFIVRGDHVDVLTEVCQAHG